MRLMMIIYLFLCVHTLVHELGHVLCAKKSGLNICRIQLGVEALSITVRKVSVSPLMIGGYTEIQTDRICSLSRGKIWLFFEAGVMGNLLLILLTAAFCSGFYQKTGILLGILLIVSNQLPFGRGDLSICRKVLIQKKESS